MKKTVKCPVCGELALSLRTGPNRFVTHRRMAVEVPHDFPLPECSSCGARPINLRLAEKLDPLLEAAYQKRLTQLVNDDLDRLAVTRPLYEWETVLGYSKGWLSKIREAKSPSPQAVALIRLMANAPEREKELKELWATHPTTHVVAGVSVTVSEKRIPEPPKPALLQVHASVQVVHPQLTGELDLWGDPQDSWQVAIAADGNDGGDDVQDDTGDLGLAA